MDFRKLRYFSRIAEIGSLNRASEKIMISQPSLSRQMRLLEEELGVRLFNRHRRGVQLTPAGQELYRRIHAPLDQIEQALRDLRALAAESSAQLVVALCPSLAHLLAVPLRKRIEEAAPNISLRLIESFPGNTGMALHRGEIDIAMIYGPTTAWSAMEWGKLICDMKIDDLLEEDLVLVGGADSALSPDRPVMLRDLAGMRLVLPERQNQIHSMKRLLDSIETALGKPVEYIKADSFQLQKSIVEAGDAYGIFPLSAMINPLKSGRIRYAPFADIAVDRNIVLVTHPKTQYPKAAQQVVTLIKEEIARLISQGDWPGAISLHYPAAPALG